jgi:glyoxylase I family protein
VRRRDRAIATGGDHPRLTTPVAQLAFLYSGVIYRAGNSLMGLRPVGSDRFDEDRVGLDHLAFAVADRQRLTEAKDIGASYILEFRDPDNIALEFVASKARLDSSR